MAATYAGIRRLAYIRRYRSAATADIEVTARNGAAAGPSSTFGSSAEVSPPGGRRVDAATAAARRRAAGSMPRRRSTRRPSRKAARGPAPRPNPTFTASSRSPPVATAMTVDDVVATLERPMYRPAEAFGMMSVISAQSTARNVPAAAPNSTPRRSPAGSARSRDEPLPDAADRARRVDHRLAPDPVGQPRRRHDRDDVRRARRRRAGSGCDASASSCVIPKTLQVDHDEVRAGSPARHQEERAATRAATRTSAPGGCRCPTPRGRWSPRLALRAAWAAAPCRPGHDADHRHELDDRDRDERQRRCCPCAAATTPARTRSRCRRPASGRRSRSPARPAAPATRSGT